jgi:hypothetical protein
MVRLTTRALDSSARCGVAVVALICLMSACSGKSATSYADTRGLAQALNANGIACTGFSHKAVSGAIRQGGAGPLKKGASLPKDSGSCSHGGRTLLLFVFASRAVRDRWVKLGTLYGSVVLGPDWSVSTQAKAAAQDISHAIGGNVQ